ncbi:hypothetical protein [Denitratimonas sp. CY0512]|uniref:hypothetical protein n=1 Tax=Denitratimonas sp. CY0512 TaxID=3131940 RepID=UPI0030A65F40
MGTSHHPSWPQLTSLQRLGVVLALLAVSGISMAGGGLSVADFNLPQQDEAGWSILTPSADSRLVYVDANAGSDSNGQFHLLADAVIGADPTQPVGAVLAFRTLAAAQAQLRQDSPDWLLLRAGGVWEESLPIRRGRSATERMVATAWGEGPRPELRTGVERGIASSHPVNVAVVGIRFWAHTRDTDGPYFTGYEGGSGMSFSTWQAPSLNQVRDVLIEDCVFRTYANNVFTGDAPNEPITRLAVRRSIISGNYKTTGMGHSQGIYHSGKGHGDGVATILLQENLFDHNGWRIQSINGNNDAEGGQATIFNHNTYFSSASNVLFQRNLFLRPSSISNKWTAYLTAEHYDSRRLVTDNNLYVDGEIGISLGGNYPPGGALRFDDIAIHNNVFTDIGRSRPTNRSLSWSVEAIDWKYGSIRSNLFIHQRAPITNSYALQVTAPSQGETVLVENNVIANFHSSTYGGLVRLQDGGNFDQVLFHNNTVQASSESPLVSLDPGGYLFTGNNRYHSPAAGNRHFRVDGTYMGVAEWAALTGDSGASTDPVTFPAPERDLETYIEHLGLGSGFDDFLTAVYGQSRGNWNPALGAAAINDWLRGGFGMPAVGHGNRIFGDGFEP